SRLFPFKIGLYIGQYLCAQAVKCLTGTAYRDTHTVHMRMREKLLIAQSDQRITITKIVPVNPCGKWLFIPGWRKTCIEQNLPVSQCGKFLVMEQYCIFVQTGHDNFAFLQQLFERQETVTFLFGFFFFRPGKVSNLCSEKFQ